MSRKQCLACTESKETTQFNKDSSTWDGYRARCKPCDKARAPYQLKRLRVKMSAAESKNRRSIRCKRYEKTRKGFLVRAYRNMKSRVTGIQKSKAHIYKGLSILTKEEFYAWAFADSTYNGLFDIWEKSGYARTLSPSVDRIDSTKGYEQGNIRWLTHSKNSQLGALSQWSRVMSISTSAPSPQLPPLLPKRSTRQTA